ncbi:MAG: CRISPR-associated endoribonuclease Cas6 [Pyrinomonadaceae bacterium]|nr:CRISPR-associated endoribonuclease Cas6 [Pyrinomonadaceae bacterium]MDW8304894.1 CRISPR-associated endoribonuclease Cas6 [Acidobacteriota bacterium]
MIKEAMKEGDFLLYESFYKLADQKNSIKPFTFSAYFPNMTKVGSEVNEPEKLNVKPGEKLLLNFSTSSLEVGAAVYNGFCLLKGEEKGYDFFGGKIFVKSIQLKPARSIRSNSVCFKTLSPVLLSRKPETDEEKKYVLPGEEGFEECLCFNLSEMSKAFLGITLKNKPVLTPTKGGRKVVYHYGQNIPGYSGYFRLEAQKEILNLVYFAGLGVRRSQGFGMLEVATEQKEEGERV